MEAANQRLLALDVLRGITIAGMVLVNSPGSWRYAYAPLKHASWHGFTPTDLVVPFFVFLMGVSMYISFQKSGFECSRTAVWKIVKRCCILFFIGLVLSWFYLFFSRWNSLSSESVPFWTRLGQSVGAFENIRITGVLQRLALCYGFAAIIALFMKHKHIPYLIATLLVSYLLLLMFGNGYEYNETNILSIVDRAVLGLNHTYNDNGIDPEGLLGTIPSIAHVLIGFCFGKWLVAEKDMKEKLLRLFLAGTVLTFAGFLLSYGCPINKKIWSPTYVLITCGLASSFLALLIWTIDVKGYKKWSRFFEAFGVNPLFMFVFSELLNVFVRGIRFPYNESAISLHGYTYNVILRPLIGNNAGSLVFALVIVALVWISGYFLFKKKIYVKI
jgi:predicted acyltransferase